MDKKQCVTDIIATPHCIMRYQAMQNDTIPDNGKKSLSSTWKNRLEGFVVGVASGVAATILCAFGGRAISGILHPQYAVGDVVRLGRYEQDNIPDDGPELIEWYVIASKKEDNSYLLLSRHILDLKPYNTDRKRVSWENCSLRVWLNKGFAENVFNDKELKKIIPTLIENSDNTKSESDGGNTTRDTVFLLSASEAEQYLTRETARGISTDYAFWLGARTIQPGFVDLDKSDTEYFDSHNLSNSSGGKTILPSLISKEYCWFLRTPGSSQEMVSRVYNTYFSKRFSKIGVFIDSDGVMVDAKQGIRPALWYRP